MEEVKKEVKKAKPEQKKRTGNSVTGKPLDQIDTKPQLDSVTEEAGKAVVLTYGRMNPPTIGHEKLINKVKQHAKEHNADHLIVASHSQDAKKNPLTADQKLHHLHRAFPGTNIQTSNKEHPSFIHQLKKLSGKYDHVHLVVGSDRVPEFEKVANKYNGKEYHFKKIHVVSAGHRDPDAEGTEGMSASKMRDHVKNNDYNSFKKGIPSKMSDSHSKRMFHDIRSGMGLNEEVEQIDEKKALTIAQRQVRARHMRTQEPKLHRKRELAQRKIAGKEQLQRRSMAAAREIVKRRFSAKKGVRYQELTTSEKIAVDRAVEKKAGLIKKIASRLIPKIRQAEYARFKSFTGGAPMQSMHSLPATIAASYEPSAIDKLFEQFFSKEQTRSLQNAIIEAEGADPQNLDILLRLGLADPEQLQLFRRAMKDPEKSVKEPLLRGKLVAVLNKLMDIVTKDPSIFAKTRMKIQQKEQKALFKKSQQTGLPLAVIEEVYTRGYENPHSGMSAEQSGFARVNSFIAGGAALEQDNDLLENIDEDLRKWFNQKWVRMDTKGEIKGDCAREDGEGKPKCLPQAKAQAMDKDDRAKAARRKRREDPVADRQGKGGKPVNVATEAYIAEKNSPTNPALWSRAKALARSKFDVYPSAYANGWAAKYYKSKGGGWKSVSEEVIDEKCWDGYKQAGMKKKGTKIVPNCVPEDIAFENFMDGKGPGKPGDSARHGLKGKSTAELKSIRSSDTASPRKKQLAHFMLNMTRKESIEEGYDVNSKHYKALTDLDLNTKNRDMTTKHDGYGPLNPNDEKGSKKFWEEKAKMWKTTTEAAREARCGNCAAFNQAPAIMKKMAEGLGPAGEKIQELSNLGFCELFEFKCAGDRTCNKWLVNGPIKEETDLNKNFNIQFASGVGVTLTAADLGMKAKSGFQLHPSVVEEEHPNCGTPECCGQCEVEEEVRSADVRGVVVHTASGKTVVRRQKTNKKIIATGNLTDGKPDDPV